MQDYRKLLKYLESQCLGTEVLTFDEIYNICGVKIDHTFIDKKQYFKRNGFEVTRINLSKRTVLFSRIP